MGERERNDNDVKTSIYELNECAKNIRNVRHLEMHPSDSFDHHMRKKHKLEKDLKAGKEPTQI